MLGKPSWQRRRKASLNFSQQVNLSKIAIIPKESTIMAFLSSIRTRYLAWLYSTPLPDLPDVAAPPVFQHWHVFDEPTSKWIVVQLGPDPPSTQGLGITSSSISQTPIPPEPANLRVLTWNIDAFGETHESRMQGILSNLQTTADGCGPDVVFFQEVSRKALAYLLQNTWVRESWFVSEADETNWADVSFATMTLLARSRFSVLISGNKAQSHSPPTRSLSLGPVWRVKYPSRFNRDALCCDIFWNRTTRIRLVNVHLDSLPIQPNQRPRQVAIAADLLRAAGRGLVAGDWNPVSEEDLSLVQKNGLIDAWEYLYPGEDGYTWGLDGAGEPFPPARLDKVAIMSLRLRDASIVHPGIVPGDKEEEKVPWSDHSGLFCGFTIGDGTRS